MVASAQEPTYITHIYQLILSISVDRLGGDLGRNSTFEASNSRFVNLPGQAVIGVSETPQDEICYELQRLNEQIENLQTSEDERLARELQAIELNIQETERKIQHVGILCFILIFTYGYCTLILCNRFLN